MGSRKTATSNRSGFAVETVTPKDMLAGWLALPPNPNRHFLHLSCGELSRNGIVEQKEEDQPARGIENENFEPRPTALSTHSRPPCASTMCFAMDKPSPVPPASRDR